MSQLWTIAEIVAATGGRSDSRPETPVTSISIDSREIVPGALFVAIRGENFDGHDFVERALAGGAVAALVSEAYAAEHGGQNLIVVPDPLAGLTDLAQAARSRSPAQIVAVTGSAGKTTTKEALRAALAASGETHASIKSFNNHWGVPLSLARLPREAQFGIFEIGMNHSGEITPLAKLVRPHVAVITTIAAAHLEFFDSVADIAAAKAEIFFGLEPGGTAVLNADHDYLAILIDHARRAGVANIVTYGFGENADWRITQLTTVDGHSVASIVHGGETIEMTLQVAGRHMVANAVAALAVADIVGADGDAAITALAGLGAPVGRGAVDRLGPADKPLILVDESYNANLASMAAALEVFGAMGPVGGEKVLVLGDMLELGETGPALHASLKDRVLATGTRKIFLVGSSIGALAAVLPAGLSVTHAETVEEISDAVLSSLAYGDAIMVKGSNGVRLAYLVKRIRERFQTPSQTPGRDA